MTHILTLSFLRFGSLRRLLGVPFLALVLLASAANPIRAENTISATASDIGCGNMSIKGTITLDTGYTLDSCDMTVKVEVWQNEGELLTGFTASISSGCGYMFSGNSTASYSAATYYVRAVVTVNAPDGSTIELDFVTTVTIN